MVSLNLKFPLVLFGLVTILFVLLKFHFLPEHMLKK